MRTAQPDPVVLDTEAKTSWPLVIACALFLTGVFFAADHEFNFSTLDLLALDTDLSASSTRKYGLLALAGVGTLLLLAPGRIAVRFNSVLGLVALVYFAWMCSSVVWSTNPSVTVKRIVTVTIIAVGVLGVARHLNSREIVSMIFVASTVLVLTGVLAELRYSTFQPWHGEYRFTGTIHPNEQATICSMMCLSSFFSARLHPRQRYLYLAFSLLGFSLFFFTKSRTALAAFIVACGALWMIRASLQRKVFVGLAGAFGVAAILMMVTVLELETADKLVQAQQLGRKNEGDDADIGSLNGRLPLWTAAIRHIGDRAITGYGYDGFWTPERSHQIAAEAGWLAPNAHSFWIDTALSFGLVGLSLVIIGLLTFAGYIFQCARHSTEPLIGLVFVAFGVTFITSFAESDLHIPASFAPFMMGTAVARLAFCRVKRNKTRFLARPTANLLPLPQPNQGFQS